MCSFRLPLGLTYRLPGLYRGSLPQLRLHRSSTSTRWISYYCKKSLWIHSPHTSDSIWLQSDSITSIEKTLETLIELKRHSSHTNVDGRICELHWWANVELVRLLDSIRSNLQIPRSTSCATFLDIAFKVVRKWRLQLWWVWDEVQTSVCGSHVLCQLVFRASIHALHLHWLLLVAGHWPPGSPCRSGIKLCTTSINSQRRDFCGAPHHFLGLLG